MLKREPIGARYNLDRLESMVLEDLDRLTQQLARLEASDDMLNDTRKSTADNYREMIRLRRRLLEEIREKSHAFNGVEEIQLASATN